METINFTKEALYDLEYWKKSGNVIILKRVRQLLQAIQSDPYTGIGKPEVLKHNLTGLWSRRINHEHRLILQNRGKLNYSNFAEVSLYKITITSKAGLAMAGSDLGWVSAKG